ncbi:(2Fe-2S)-binding protein [Elioraea sp.]|uniref:(2Fe-2S)-binding protein n=1 Tax=Elioraea sp. TaxID=2185103 RepID=UPI0025C581E2|nr:(2Fe-2S)-binding protein [Elioraea sp.]
MRETVVASPMLFRVASFDTPVVNLTVDGRSIQARRGESVLAAMLSHGGHVRRHEHGGAPRASFCLMGACQDCWVWIGAGERARACTTPVADGMEVSTSPTVHGG